MKKFLVIILCFIIAIIGYFIASRDIEIYIGQDKDIHNIFHKREIE